MTLPKYRQATTIGRRQKNRMMIVKGYPILVLVLLVNLLPLLIYGQEFQSFQFTGTMELSPISPSAKLNGEAIVEWQTTTAEVYINYLLSEESIDPPIIDPEADITLIFASSPQDDTNGIALQFQATVSFISESTSYDASELARSAFQNNFQYLRALKDSGLSIFENIDSISTLISDSESIPSPTPAPVVSTTSSPTLGQFTPSPTAPGSGGIGTPEPTSASALPQPVSTPTLMSAPEFEGEGTPEPTASPVVSSPTEWPTLAPATMAPGLITMFTTTEVILDSVPSQMNGNVSEYWKRATEAYLIDYVQDLQSDFLAGFSLEIGKITQTSLVDRRQLLRRQQPQKRKRHLQGNATFPLLVEFVSYSDLQPGIDASSLITGAFLTDSRREVYRSWVKNASVGSSSEGFFATLDEVRFIDNENPDDDDDPNGGDSDDKGKDDDERDGPKKKERDGGMSGALIGGIVGGVIFIWLFALFAYVQNRDRSRSTKDTNSGENQSDDIMGNDTFNASPTSQAPLNKGNPAGLKHNSTWGQVEQPSRLNQEIMVRESMDDVSTIGEPYLYGQPSPIQDDDRTATTSVFQTETYNALLGRQRDPTYGQSMKSTADETEFSAFTGASKYLGHNNIGGAYQQAPKRSLGPLGELGFEAESDETSFEQRLFPMEKEDDEGRSFDDKSLDFSLPTAMM